MKIALVYPIPSDNLNLFQPDIDTFFRTLIQFNPGHEYELILVNSHYRQEFRDAARTAVGLNVLGDCLPPHTASDSASEWINIVRTASGLNLLHASEWLNYTGQGCDIGSHQFAAHALDYDLMVCCSTRVYFHRAGWLARLVEAWNMRGPGLYGAMACYERAPHIRTCFYALRPADFRKYPKLIQSRDHTFLFETGEWNFTRWAIEEGITPRMVTWDGIWTMDDWRRPANIYRRGDQSNVLAWDRHSKIYSEADPKRKHELECYAGDHRK